MGGSITETTVALAGRRRVPPPRRLGSWRWRAAAGPPPTAPAALAPQVLLASTDHGQHGLGPAPERRETPWRWATSASGRLWPRAKHTWAEATRALWWGYNMMERFRDYSVDPAFPSY